MRAHAAILGLSLTLASTAAAQPGPQEMFSEDLPASTTPNAVVRDLTVTGLRDVAIVAEPGLQQMLGQLTRHRVTKPMLRELQWYYMRRYPFNWKPKSDWRSAALQHIRERIALPRDAESARWVELTGSDVPGRVTSVLQHPTQKQVVYAGTGGGGVWKSTDEGRTWKPLTDGQCSLSVGALAADPGNPDVIYVGTGEGNFAGNDLLGCGILKTTDGGQSWTTLGKPSSHIRQIYISPDQPQTLWIAGDEGVIVSRDGGLTYENVAGGLPSGDSAGAMQVFGHPARPSRLYATFLARGAFRSDDGGVSWMPLSGLPTANSVYPSLAIAPSNPDRLYIGIGSIETFELMGFFVSDDGGTSWRQASSAPNYTGTQAWYCNSLGVDPANPDTVFVSGLDVYRSTDGAKSFKKVSDWNLMYRDLDHPQYVHADQHYVHIPESGKVWIGSDGGLSLSSNNGDTWSQRSAGLGTLQFMDVAVHPGDPRVLLAGAQDNRIHYSANGGQTWKLVGGGDGGASDFWGPDPNFAFGSYVNLILFKMNPAQVQSLDDHQMVGGAWQNEPRLFYAPFIVHPADRKTLLAGSNRVWRSTDGGANWSPISQNLCGPDGALSAIVGSPSDPNVTYAGASTGEVWVTTDGGSTWTQVNAGLPQRYITNFSVHPTQPASVVVTLGGLMAGHVFRSGDAGKTWANISQGLPDVGVYVARHNPANPQELWIGSDLGVFRSRDDGASWERAPSGLPNAAVFDLAYGSDGVMRAATHGRGLWELQGLGGTTSVAQSGGTGGDLDKYFTPGGAASAGQAPAAAVQSGSLKFELRLNKPGASPTYRIGEPFGVELSCSETCFVALGHMNSSGEFSLLVPAVKVAAGQSFKFPTKGLTVKVQPPAGQEKLVAVASTTQPPGHMLSSLEAMRAMKDSARVELTYTITE